MIIIPFVFSFIFLVFIIIILLTPNLIIDRQGRKTAKEALKDIDKYKYIRETLNAKRFEYEDKCIMFWKNRNSWSLHDSHQCIYASFAFPYDLSTLNLNRKMLEILKEKR